MSTQEDMAVINTARKLTKFLRNERIEFDEYASNMIIHLVGKDRTCVGECLADLSPDEREALLVFARTYFNDNNYTPHPVTFMVDTSDPDEVERKREELRPRYIQLMQDLEHLHST